MNLIDNIFPTLAVTAPTRSSQFIAPKGSTIALDLQGTGSIKIISNPFGAAANDLVLATVTATTHYVVLSDILAIIDCTAVTGTLSAVVIRDKSTI